MKADQIDDVVKLLREAYRGFVEPVVTQVAKDKDPYKVLISTILSLRTKDETTLRASIRLFDIADNIYKLNELNEDEIERLIYPVGFYKTKAKNLKKIARIIIENYGGKIPDDLDELLKLPNVGRKTANLVLAKGFGKPAICVDIHVHRISNRLGLVDTKTPEETEFALSKILPKKYWIEFNDLLVPFGQNICRPISPFCSKCIISKYCKRKGVNKSR
ncbi:endonuclease III domain-containing protein [Hippea maritima]|uniref:Endonuclease III n=1 Tax=Hippea maritima (strain ATCC 700847 / DSM 10411 / MH2) TaxID=760142 RepID=F2LVG4_HIPMA|nr:endonuclease III [Hippea maritima]AEA33748.1 DNA-(apurinic or apyrimidinic site) lyase [Hippea maritima DSM 10411]